MDSKKISLDNGNSYLDASDIDFEFVDWQALVNAMDNEIREQVHSALAPCTKPDFLSAYLLKAKEDLIIG